MTRKGFEEAIRHASFILVRRRLDDGRSFTTDELTGAIADETYQIDEETLTLGLGKSDLHIIPAIDGAGGRGTGKLLLGLAIVAGAVLLAPMTGGGSMVVGGHVMSATAVSLAGMSVTFGQIAFFGGVMALAGASQMLAKPPKAPDAASKQDSFIFSGPANVSSQSNPVPVVHGGPIRTGSVTVSAGIFNERISTSFAPNTSGGYVGGGIVGYSGGSISNNFDGGVDPNALQG